MDGRLWVICQYKHSVDVCMPVNLRSMTRQEHDALEVLQGLLDYLLVAFPRHAYLNQASVIDLGVKVWVCNRMAGIIYKQALPLTERSLSVLTPDRPSNVSQSSSVI